MAATLFVLGVLLVGTWARADEPQTVEKAGCVSSHVRAQELRRDGKLRAARDAFLVCARDECPPLVKKDCAELLEQVTSALPTVVIEVRDRSGNDTSAVALAIDGQHVADRLPERAIEVDPGEHVFRFRASPAEVIEQRVVIREGDRMRRLKVSFVDAPSKLEAGPSDPDASTRSAGFSPLVYVIGGLAAVGVGTFAVFAIIGKQKESELEECRPNCSLGEVGVMRTHYLVADVSLVVGLLAAGAATYFALARPSPPKKTARPVVLAIGF